MTSPYLEQPFVPLGVTLPHHCRRHRARRQSRGRAVQCPTARRCDCPQPKGRGSCRSACGHGPPQPTPTEAKSEQLAASRNQRPAGVGGRFTTIYVTAVTTVVRRREERKVLSDSVRREA